MWTDIRQEIERARQELGLTPAQFRPLGLAEWPAVEKRTAEAFCQLTPTNRQPTWLWNQLKPELPSAFFDLEGLSWAVVKELLQPTDEVFLFASDGDKWWWHRGTGSAAEQVAIKLSRNSAHLDEWSIVDQHFRWLLCLTHHDELVAAGPFMVQRLRQLANKLKRPLRFYPAIARPAK
ncbi:DUF6756 family protein [Hymenobacter edaphi]|uniref:Uncharacterized protein n=1 Tax=Hymenobacter edaphi TaxID=2211146 RepID=A0A328BW75_9BACT|nr:DUF6756 family protein [Hymenobacter edaphi]RAK70296.1 hypothetical protein DLM85_05485 [Hymenobacter edaphi]